MFKVGVVEGSAGIDIYLKDISHATSEEIAAGHRIDHIEQDNDMGDDTHIENHVSPLCKVGVK